MGLNVYPSGFVGIGIEWRALPFSWNTSGFDNRGGGKDGGGARLTPFGTELIAAYRDFGHDIDNTDNPWETGLGFAVSLKKPGGFIGREACVAAKAVALRSCRMTGLSGARASASVSRRSLSAQ